MTSRARTLFLSFAAGTIAADRTLSPSVSGSRAVSGTSSSAREAAAHLEAKLVAWLAERQPLLSRLALAVVYFWFGALKLIGVSPASALVARLQATTLGHRGV